MKEQKKEIKYPSKWLWIFGINGFNGFNYFKTGDASKLFFFAFFAFFAYYFINKIVQQKQDERMLENHKKAVIMASKIPIIALFIIGAGPQYFSVPPVFFILVSTIGVATYIITYASAFFYYERYT